MLGDGITKSGDTRYINNKLNKIYSSKENQQYFAGAVYDTFDFILECIKDEMANEDVIDIDIFGSYSEVNSNYETIVKYEKGVTNYEFVNSKDNTMIQISDLVAGLLGKMFTFINSIPNNDMRKTVTKLNDVQICNCLAFNGLRKKSDLRNKGFLHSLTTLGILDKLNQFFGLVENEHKRRHEIT